MADPRTRPYPSAPSAHHHHQNGPSPTASRERAFNDIFNTGRPAVPQPQHSHHQQYPNGNGNGSAYSPSSKPPMGGGGGGGYPDSRGYHRQMAPHPNGPPPSIPYQEPVRRSPPTRQYSMPNDINVPPPREQRTQLSPRQHSTPQFDPRMNVGGARQVSAPHPQQRMYNDIPPSHQRPSQDYPPLPPPNGSDYRTKSLTTYNSRGPPPPSHRFPPSSSSQKYPSPQDAYTSTPSTRINTTADGRIVPERPYDRSYTMSSPPISSPNDRSYSLTTQRPSDRAYTLSSTSNPERTYPATRPAAQSSYRRPVPSEDGSGRSMSLTTSGRGGGGVSGSTPMDLSRPVQPRQQIPPGSPRRGPPSAASASSRAGLSGVREEGTEQQQQQQLQQTSPASLTSLPPLTTSVAHGAVRHESVDSTSSDFDSVSGPQRTKSSSSFPAVSPSSANTDRRPSLPKAPPSTQMSISRTRAPIVYPALLSRVAIALRERLILGDKQKDGLTYPNAFTGSEAVDLIAYVIKTSDRNLALLLGRALDAQRWFHDVTYVHRYADPESASLTIQAA